MSIQQSLNQALFAAQMGAGLYANTPSGQDRAAIRQLESKGKKLDKAMKATSDVKKEWSDMSAGLGRPVPQAFTSQVQDIQGKLTAQQKDVSDQLLNKDPSAGRVRDTIYRGLVKESAQAEANAEQNITVKQSSIQNQKYGMEMRMDALKDLRNSGIMSNTQFKHYAHEVQKGGDK